MSAWLNRRGALAAALCVALIPGELAAAAVKKPAGEKGGPEKRTLDYAILKDGESIGGEKVDITRDGDTVTVDVAASTRVKLLMLNFSYDHKRREVWRGGALESLSADTNDDGTRHKVEMVRAGTGYRLTVDGQTSDLPADALPLALWTADVVKSALLIGVSDGQRYKAAAKALGDETIDVGGRTVKAKRWRISGDIERDLWFAEDGSAAQIAFKRRGYDIVYRLK